MPYNFAADSFHTKKLCSRLSSSEVRFFTQIGRFAFLRPPLGMGVYKRGGDGARCTMAKIGGNVVMMMLLLVSIIIYYCMNTLLLYTSALLTCCLPFFLY